MGSGDQNAMNVLLTGKSRLKKLKAESRSPERRRAPATYVRMETNGGVVCSALIQICVYMELFWLIAACVNLQRSACIGSINGNIAGDATRQRSIACTVVRKVAVENALKAVHWGIQQSSLKA